MSGAASETQVWPLYRAMVGVGLLCGFLIVTVFQTTRPVIARNRAIALEQAILHVLPGATSYRSFRLEDDRFVALEEEPGSTAPSDRVVHAGYDSNGRALGVAIEASGMGYQDTLRVLYGYSFEFAAIVGMEVLESRETPGLGDRIESDPEFQQNFERLAVRLDSGGSLEHEIEAVPAGSKTEPWQIDAISGATISSQAIAEILSRSAALSIPLIERRASDFTDQATADGTEGIPS